MPWVQSSPQALLQSSFFRKHALGIAIKTAMSEALIPIPKTLHTVLRNGTAPSNP